MNLAGTASNAACIGVCIVGSVNISPTNQLFVVNRQSQMADVIDTAAYEEYRKHVPAIIAAYGGRYLVRGGATRLLEGAGMPQRTVVLEFASMEKLEAFYSSPEYTPLKELRFRAARSRIFAVEGV